jgi:hypothetical protein
VSVDPKQDHAFVAVRLNRVAGGAQADTEFRGRLHAFSGAPGSHDDNDPTPPVSLAVATSILFSDANPATWEEATVELDVPRGTTYNKVGISAFEDVFDDTGPGDCPMGEEAKLWEMADKQRDPANGHRGREVVRLSWDRRRAP